MSMRSSGERRAAHFFSKLNRPFTGHYNVINRHQIIFWTRMLLLSVSFDLKKIFFHLSIRVKTSAPVGLVSLSWITPMKERCHCRTGMSIVQRRKWSPTANDPQTGNDPRIGPQMIPAENEEWHGVWFPGFFFIFYFIFIVIYFHR